MSISSDSSEDEDLSKFKEVVVQPLLRAEWQSNQGTHSERYLDTATHYNDVKVPCELQNRIGAKLSALIEKNTEFVECKVKKKHKTNKKQKGGVKLFRDSTVFLSAEEAPDTEAEVHNKEFKKLKSKRRQIDSDDRTLSDKDMISAAVISGDYIMSKEYTKNWKSRRKEKIFRYKSQGKSNILQAID